MEKITVDNLEQYCVYAGKHRGCLTSEGVQRAYRFPNGYGASVVRYKVSDDTYGSYTTDETEWELAVIKFESDDDDDFALTYDTPITDDVIGHLQEEQVKETLLEIAHLVVADDGSIVAPKTMVIFRVYSDGDVLALFLCTPSKPGFCNSYMHIGQHGAAAYHLCVRQTRPATPEEAMPLADELKGLGYSLSVRQRAPSGAYREKWLAMGND